MKKIYLILSLTFIFMLSCENNLEMSFPKGPQGEQGAKGDKGDKGDKGEDGLSAFDLWKMVFQKDANTTMEEFFTSLRGKDGKDGANGNTPVIGESGNWFIGGIDTGIPTTGKDGANGKDGVTPEVGANGNWYIGDKDTGFPARGKDGADGQIPTIGSNGNWYIGNIDTGVPATGKDGKDGLAPTIGTNGNWYIGFTDTGIQATGKDGKDGNDGKDGTNGQSAYDLWKAAVDTGSMTNKDGSDYTDGNSWEAFLRWLQGGDVSVLHQYWLSQGNTGDLEAFIVALFSNPSDNGFSVFVYAKDTCVELKPDGSLAKNYTAELIVEAEAGTLVKITGLGVDHNELILTGNYGLSLTVLRGDEDKTLTVVAKLPITNEEITKIVTIPALKYIKLDQWSVVPIEESDWWDRAIVIFKTAPTELLINDVVVYKNGVVIAGSNWHVGLFGGTTFFGGYQRLAEEQKLTVQARGANGECSIIKDLFVIPKLGSDGLSVFVEAEDTCVELDADGSVAKDYIASVLVTAEPGTKVKCTVGVIAHTITASDDGKVQFGFIRGDTEMTGSIVATLPITNEVITKTITIPALKYIKLKSYGVTPISGGEEDLLEVIFETAPTELRINDVIVYENGALVAGSGWDVHSEGKEFNNIYKRSAEEHKLTVQARGANGECSIIKDLFVIPKLALPSIEYLGDPVFTLAGCDIKATVNGTPGMTVKAVFKESNLDLSKTIALTESPVGVYTGLITRTFKRFYEVTFNGEKAGFDNITMTGEVDGSLLFPIPFSTGSGTNTPSQATRYIKNELNVPINVVVSRSVNSNSASVAKSPWMTGFPDITSTQTWTLDPLEMRYLYIQRDLAPGFEYGQFVIDIVTTPNECGKVAIGRMIIENETEF